MYCFALLINLYFSILFIFILIAIEEQFNTFEQLGRDEDKYYSKIDNHNGNSNGNINDNKNIGNSINNSKKVELGVDANKANFSEKDIDDANKLIIEEIKNLHVFNSNEDAEEFSKLTNLNDLNNNTIEIDDNDNDTDDKNNISHKESKEDKYEYIFNDSSKQKESSNEKEVRKVNVIQEQMITANTNQSIEKIRDYVNYFNSFEIKSKFDHSSQFELLSFKEVGNYIKSLYLYIIIKLYLI